MVTINTLIARMMNSPKYRRLDTIARMYFEDEFWAVISRTYTPRFIGNAY